MNLKKKKNQFVLYNSQWTPTERQKKFEIWSQKGRFQRMINFAYIILFFIDPIRHPKILFSFLKTEVKAREKCFRVEFAA